MDPSRIAIATVTWARSAVEASRLTRALTRLAAAGLPVAVADTGTNESFTALLESFPGFNITVPERPGLIPQIQASFKVAATLGKPFVLYVEPDKELFFAHGLSDFVRRAPDDSDVGVVLASRSVQSFGTFPSMQRYTEGVINQLCSELLGRHGDYSYGPFLLNRSLLGLVQHLRPQLGWGWRHFIFREARRQGLSVDHISGEYPCPPDQRVEDELEQVHRLRQLSQNILGLIEASPQP